MSAPPAPPISPSSSPPTTPATSPPTGPVDPGHPQKIAHPTLTIRDTGPDCYVEVRNRHGKVLFRDTIHDKRYLTFRGHGLRVNLGNAGAVLVGVDGFYPRRVGKLGQVRKFTVV